MSEVHKTHRWRGILAVGLFAGAVGILADRPNLLLVAVVGVVYTAFPRVTSPPTVDLSIERSVSERKPSSERPVEVTVTVRNEGDSFLPDLRIVDGVPPMLSVVDGTARHTASLRSGGTSTFSYTVKATRGVHQFESATAIARDWSGANEVETTVSADQAIECTEEVPSVPIRQQTQRQSFGQIVTDQGGSGVEFHQLREYRRGDSMRRIDWKRFARNGELTTIEFQKERTASIVLCLDGREEAYRTRTEGEPHAVAYELAAAERLLAGLIDEHVNVGLTAVGREFTWLGPNVGDGHYLEARQLLSDHPTFSVYPPNGTAPNRAVVDRQMTEISKYLGKDDQVVLISPLGDEVMPAMATDLEAADHSVTVISPDVTTDETIGGRLTAVERENRIRSLRNSGIPVIDWPPDEAFGTVLMRAEDQWF